MESEKPRHFFNEDKSKHRRPGQASSDGREKPYTYEELQKHDGTAENLVYSIFHSLTAIPEQDLTPRIPRGLRSKVSCLTCREIPHTGHLGHTKVCDNAHLLIVEERVLLHLPHDHMLVTFHATTSELTLFNRSLRWQRRITGNGDIEFET